MQNCYVKYLSMIPGYQIEPLHHLYENPQPLSVLAYQADHVWVVHFSLTLLRDQSR